MNPRLLPGDQHTPKLLIKPEQLEREIAVMSQVDSMEAFVAFYDRYQQCTLAQQEEISAAFVNRTDHEVQFRFGGIWKAFEQTQVIPETSEVGLAVPSQIELPGLDVTVQKAAIGDWEADIYG